MDKSTLRKAKTALKKDPVLSPLIQQVKPLILESSGNVYRELVKNIVYQQISYKAADSIYNKFLNLIATEAFFPEDIIKTSHESLRSAGLSNQKAQYIRNISEFFEDKQLYDFNWQALSDEEIIALLTQIKGVGVWTSKMILIFELLRPDVWPYEDLAIQHVMKELYGLNEEKKALFQKMEKIASDWRPYRTIAGLYLWSYRRWQYSNP